MKYFCGWKSLQQWGTVLKVAALRRLRTTDGMLWLQVCASAYILCGTGYWDQGFHHAGQVLYQVSQIPISLKVLLERFHFILCAWVFWSNHGCLCRHIWLFCCRHTCLVAAAIGREHQVLWSWSYAQLWAALWMLEIKPRLSAKTNAQLLSHCSSTTFQNLIR